MAALVLVLPALQACYEYVPIAEATPKVGEMLSFEISDQGRAALSDRFGVGVTEIEAKLVAAQADEYTVNVFKVSQIGSSTLWSGETARLQRGYVIRTKQREFSKARTALVAIAAAAATGALIATAKLTGSFNGSTDEPVTQKPQSIRIPFGVRP